MASSVLPFSHESIGQSVDSPTRINSKLRSFSIRYGREIALFRFSELQGGLFRHSNSQTSFVDQWNLFLVLQDQFHANQLPK